MKIGIVDTGIQSSAKAIVTNSICISDDNSLLGYSVSDDGEDYYGHGTLVTCLIHIFCPSVSLVSVRITQDSPLLIPYVQEKTLAAGIDWCIKHEIRLINVSYSIKGIKNNGPLAEVCSSAAEKGIIIIGAYSNTNQDIVYPAAFPTVIGVSALLNSEYGKYLILSEYNHDIAAFGGPYEVTAPDKSSRLIYGTSFASAQVTGMIGRMLIIKPELTLKEIFKYFKKYSC
ncbi:MAG: S8 family serine peptidase [Planctomycetaceae bacterium]|jgi:subtilisin family serine protease|nr:S8 family serine peptidase [Planctomycetaceae bacterium]